MTYKQELSMLNKLYNSLLKSEEADTRVSHRGWRVIRSIFELMGHGDHVPGCGPLRKGCSLETRPSKMHVPSQGRSELLAWLCDVVSGEGCAPY